MCALQPNTIKSGITFSRRIEVQEGLRKILIQDVVCPRIFHREWFSSSILIIPQECFFECKSFTSIAFEVGSKLQQIGESAFAWSGLTTIHIPASVEVFCKRCFCNSESLISITFEPNSRLRRIEDAAFAWNGLTEFLVPASVEVLCNCCFLSCTSLKSITFELGSKLQRIEGAAFRGTSLTELSIPNSIQFLSGLAIVGLHLDPISFWSGPCEFQVYEMFIEDITGRSIICYIGQSDKVLIESRIEILIKFSFAYCNSLSTVIFESNSKLQRIEEAAFAWSELKSIIIPASVEMLGKNCFFDCGSLTSVTFEPNSKVQQIEEYTFARTGLTGIIIPASVEILCQLCFANCESLTSVKLESNSKLREVAPKAFAWSPLLSTIDYPPSLHDKFQAVVLGGIQTYSSDDEEE
jgi:hypothetical protein